MLACLAKDAFFDEDDELEGEDADEYGLHGSPLQTVQQAWRHAQKRAKRRQHRQRGGHRWSTVLPAHASGKALRVAQQLAERNVRTSLPDSSRLAAVVATAVIVHAWRHRSAGAVKKARNMQSMLNAVKGPRPKPPARRAPAADPTVPGYLL